MQDTVANQLILLVSQNNSFHIKSILEEHPEWINAQGFFGISILQTAISKKNVDLVEWLIQHKADLCSTDNSGNSPLHTAVTAGDSRIVALLIEAGSDVQAVNQSHQTPLHFVNSKSCAYLLLDAGSDPEARDQNGITALEAIEDPELRSEIERYFLENRVSGEISLHSSENQSLIL